MRGIRTILDEDDGEQTFVRGLSVERSSISPSACATCRCTCACRLAWSFQERMLALGGTLDFATPSRRVATFATRRSSLSRLVSSIPLVLAPTHTRLTPSTSAARRHGTLEASPPPPTRRRPPLDPARALDRPLCASSSPPSPSPWPQPRLEQLRAASEASQARSTTLRRPPRFRCALSPSRPFPSVWPSRRVSLADLLLPHFRCLQSAASPPSQGSYVFKNVATGQTLSYTVRSLPSRPRARSSLPRRAVADALSLQGDGNHIVPSDGPATPVQVLGYGASVPWVRLQIGDKDKCLSAQWGGSYNLAGVMYSCAVDSGGEVIRAGTSSLSAHAPLARASLTLASDAPAGNTLEPTKQWWLMVPVSDYAGDASTSTHVLLAAQAHSVATREKANRTFSRRRSLHSSASPAFARVKRSESNVVTTPPAAPRQAWSVLAAEFQAAEAKRIEEEKLALEAEARKEAERSAAARKAADAVATASGAASHTAALASTAAASTVEEVPPPPSSTVEAAVDPVSLVKVDTVDKDVVEDVKPAEDVYEPQGNVKLNVGGGTSSSSGAYFIIPVRLPLSHSRASTNELLLSCRSTTSSTVRVEPLLKLTFPN